MKKIYSPNQQEFEPVRKIEVKATPIKLPLEEDLDYILVEAEEIVKLVPEKKTNAAVYAQKVARNMEIMGDLIWRYSPSDEMAEQLKNSKGAHWLALMDRMKRICQLCDIDSPLYYSAIWDICPVRQKIIQRELETIRGRYGLEEWSTGFEILEGWYVRGQRN